MANNELQLPSDATPVESLPSHSELALPNDVIFTGEHNESDQNNDSRSAAAGTAQAQSADGAPGTGDRLAQASAASDSFGNPGANDRNAQPAGQSAQLGRQLDQDAVDQGYALPGQEAPTVSETLTALNTAPSQQGKEEGYIAPLIAGAVQKVSNFFAQNDEAENRERALLGEKPQTSSLGAVKTAGHIALEALAIPQRITLGNAARAVNPQLMENVRRRDIAEGVPEWEQQLHKIAPPIYMGADVLKPYIQQKSKELGVAKGSMLDSFVHDAASIAAIGFDIETDPLMSVKFLQPAKAFEEARAAGLASEVIKGEEVYKIAMPSGQDAYVARNKWFMADPTGTVAPGAVVPKDLVQIKPPGFSKPLLSIEGKDIQKWGAIKSAQLTNTWMGKGLNFFNSSTTSDSFNQMRHVESVETGSARTLLAKVDNDFQTITNGKRISEQQSQFARWVSEHGQQGAETIAQHKGVALSIEEKETAIAVGQKMEEWRASANELAGHMGGGSAQVFKAASTDERFALVNDLTPADRAVYEKLPDGVKPYVFSDNANLHRLRNPEFVKRAKTLGLDIEEARNANDVAHASMGFPTRAKSSMERSKFSTWFLDSLKEAEFGQQGVTEAFYNPDVLVSTKHDVENMLRAASNKKFLNGVKTLGYSGTEWEWAISQAQKAVAAGSKDAEMVRLSGLDIKSLKEVDVDALNPFVTVAPGKQVAKPLLYESSVADALKTHFGVSSVNTLSAIVGEVNTAVSRNYLSSITRILPMGLGEGLASWVGAGGTNPKYLYQAIKARLIPDALYETFHNSGIEIGVNKAFDQVKKAVVTPGMYRLSEGAEAISAPMRMLNESKGFFTDSWEHATDTVVSSVRAKGKAMGLIDASGRLSVDGVRWVANNIADNPFNRKSRDWVNAMQGLPKEALFRQKMAQGMNEFEAIDFTGKRMLDFRFQPQNNASAWFTFGNFHYQNAKRLGFLIADNPWIVNLTKGDRSILKAALEDDWDPEAAGFLHRVYKMSGETIFGGVIAGSKALVRNPSVGQGVLNQVLGGLLNKLPEESLAGKALQDTKEGFQVLHYLPTALGATTHVFGDPEMGALSPVIRGAVMIAGYDLGTGKRLVDRDDKTDAMLKSVNPLANPNFWNITNAFLDTCAKAQKKNMDWLFNDPAYDMVVKVGAGARAYHTYEQSKPGEKQLESIANVLTLGLTRLSTVDTMFMMNQAAIKHEIRDFKDKVHKLQTISDPKVRSEKIGEANDRVAEKNGELKDLVKRYGAYQNANRALRMSPFSELLPTDAVAIPKEDQ